ncbi:hypothetical protein [Brevundimonas mediterranea]|uniref:hypothetical protein n=1 Tax=Brevundimonas mediterranea TaxID=74329 RepID=UPI00403351EF
MLALNDRVVVIDDDEDGRDTIVDNLDALDLKGIPIAGRFGDDIEKLLAEIDAANPSFVICDLRLTAHQFATFSGLQVVESLIARKTPAMLLTTYQDPERIHLRAARSRVPVIRGRNGFRIQEVPFLHDIVEREIAEKPVPSRVPHRVLLRIEEIRAEEDEVDVVVPSWRRNQALALPRSLFGAAVRDNLHTGDYLLGHVNIGAADEDELYFDNIDEIVEPAADML